jgi:hypothetical protein
MPKGDQRSNREKKKPKKDKGAKQPSAYASEYGKHQHQMHIADSGAGKKQ